MRNVRFEVSVRVMMAAVALVALGLRLYQECQDGLPPRFVARRVPARMARLRWGMEHQLAQATLGFDRHWLFGGVETPSNRHEPIETYVRVETYEIQPGPALENMSPDDRFVHAYLRGHFHRNSSGKWLLVGTEYSDQKRKRIRPIR